MAKSSKIGGVHVDITAKTDKLKQGLKDARSTVETEAAAMGDAVDKNVTEKFQAASGKVAGFVGSVTAVLGVAFVFKQLGEKITNVVQALVRGRDAARDFRQNLRGMSVEQIGQEIDDLNDSVTSGASEWKNLYFIVTDFLRLTEDARRSAKVALLEEERTARTVIDVRKRGGDLANKLAQADRDRADAAKELSDRVLEDLERLETESLEGIERIERERYNAFIRVQKLREQVDDEYTQGLLVKQLALINKKYDAEIRRFNEAEAIKVAADDARLQRDQQAARDREQREAQSAERTAQALERAIGSAFDRLDSRAASLNDATSSTLSALLQRIEIFIDNQGMG